MDSRPPPPQGKYLWNEHHVPQTHGRDPAGAPPPYAFVGRVYKKSLRPVVLAVAFLAGLWTLFGAIGYFRNAALDRLGEVPKLRIVYIIVGALYMLAAAIEGLGLTAAATQRVPLIRAYAYLSALTALIIIGTGLLRIIVHFTMKNDLINTCTKLAEGGDVVYFGFWGPIHRDLSRDEAELWCRRSWEHDSWQEIVAFLITAFLAFFFSAIAFSYLRQVLDPSSPANASRAPSYAIRNGEYPSHYNPPYNASVPNLGYNQPYYGQRGYGEDAFVPPYEPKPPGYSGADDAKPGFNDDSKDSKDPFSDYNGSSSRTNAA